MVVYLLMKLIFGGFDFSAVKSRENSTLICY